MERLFDLEVLNLLVASAMAEAAGLERVVGTSATEPEAIAAFALLGPNELKTTARGEKLHLSAGFRLAMLICRRIFADPLHGHRGGIKRDIAGVQRWLQDRHGSNSPTDRSGP